MVKEGGFHVAYQPLTRVERYSIIRLGHVKQFIMSYKSLRILIMC